MERAVNSPTTGADVATGAWAAAARVVVLGLNAWATLLFLPAVLGGLISPFRAAWLVLPLVPLLLGALVLDAARGAARWVLLGAFPAVSAGVLAGLPSIARQGPQGVLATSVGVLSLVAFGAVAAHAVSRPDGTRAAQLRPLGSVSPIEEHAGRRRLRRTVLVIASLGALGLVLVAPMIGGRAAYAAWGEAATEALVLTTVVATALATAVATLFVGPALRATREPPPTWRRVRRRVVALVATFAVGLAVYLVYALSS
jgi:hypothetical protein